MESSALDNLIERLIEVRSAKPGKPVQLLESEIKQLCVAARDIFINQPNLLELEAPIKICGTSFFIFWLWPFYLFCVYWGFVGVFIGVFGKVFAFMDDLLFYVWFV